MIPLNLSSLIIDCPQEGAPCDAVIGAGPAVVAVFRLEEVNAVAVLRADDEQACSRVETWRAIVGRAAFVRSDQSAITRGFLCRVRNGAAILIDSFGPVHGGKRDRQ